MRSDLLAQTVVPAGSVCPARTAWFARACMRARRAAALLFVAVLTPAAAMLAPASTAQAQPSVVIRHVRFGPSVYYYRLHLYVTCGDSVYYGMQHDDVRIHQDDDAVVPIDYVIESEPTRAYDACFDVALVFDNSSFVPGMTLTHMISAGSKFVDSLSRSCQNVAVITYAGSPSIRDFVNNDRASSKAAIAGMTATGGSALYDAVRAANTELMTNGRTTTHWMLVVCAGRDNASQARIETAISDAIYYESRIFTVAVGADADAAALKQLSSGTGGMHFTVADATQLDGLLDAVVHQMRRAWDEYIVTYKSPRMYPARKNVRVRVSICGDSTFAYKTFQLLPDATGADDPAAVPQDASIDEMHPMPVHGELRMRVSHTRTSWVRLTVVDLLGRTMAVLHDGDLPAGASTITADLATLPPGMYVCMLRTAGGTTARRIIIQR